jgi:phage tail tape-measure protein
MSETQSKTDAQRGIPAVDPAAADQGQYGSMAQGASVGAGSGAAFGGAVGAAGGPAGSVVGATVGGLAGAVAGGTIASERGPTGAAVDMHKLAENTAGAPPPQSTSGAGWAEAGADGVQ